MDDSAGGVMPPKDVFGTRSYQPSSASPWVVYFRQKVKALDFLGFKRNLTRWYPGTEFHQVNRNKLRVTAPTYKNANDIASDVGYNSEYYVYIPSRDVEIDGVVSAASLTCEDVMEGKGRLQNAVTSTIDILHCKKLQASSMVNGKKTYLQSDSLQVTFAGSILPQFVEIDKKNFPVRLFVL